MGSGAGGSLQLEPQGAITARATEHSAALQLGPGRPRGASSRPGEERGAGGRLAASKKKKSDRSICIDGQSEALDAHAGRTMRFHVQ